MFIDEVHHYGKDWSRLIKNVYDQFPGLSFVYSGSSLLKIEGGLYQQRIRAIVNKVLESDWPAVEEVSVETVRKAEKMLMILASSVTTFRITVFCFAFNENLFDF